MNIENGLYIKPINSKSFFVKGKVTVMEFNNEKVYYCNNQSFPESIVSCVIGNVEVL